MSSSTVSIRTLLSHILFSFTRGVTEHRNPQQSKYTAAESHGYSPLESTGQEWYRHRDPDEECIYQEYRDSEATSFDHRAQPISLARHQFHKRVVNGRNGRKRRSTGR